MEFNYVPESRKLHKKNRPPKSIKAVLIFLSILIGMMAFSQVLVLYTKTIEHAPKAQAATANAGSKIAAVNKELVKQKSLYESHVNAYMGDASGEDTMLEVNDAYRNNLNILIDRLRAIVPGTEDIRSAKAATLNAMLLEQANIRSIESFISKRKAKYIEEFNTTRIVSVAEIKKSVQLLK